MIKIFSGALLERQMVFVSDQPDLVSKVMFTIRDIIINQTDFKWQKFFIPCLPRKFIEHKESSLEGMIGVVRQVFDRNLEERSGAIVVDIDEGKVFGIEEYKLCKKMESFKEVANESPRKR